MHTSRVLCVFPLSFANLIQHILTLVDMPSESDTHSHLEKILPFFFYLQHIEVEQCHAYNSRKFLLLLLFTFTLLLHADTERSYLVVLLTSLFVAPRAIAALYVLNKVAQL